MTPDPCVRSIPLDEARLLAKQIANALNPRTKSNDCGGGGRYRIRTYDLVRVKHAL